MRSNSILACYIVAASLGAALAPGCASTPEPAMIEIETHEYDGCSLCELYARAREFVVVVSTPDTSGAGVVVTTEGVVATNAHVVGAWRDATIETAEGTKLAASRIALAPEEDLALFQIVSRMQWAPPEIPGAHARPPVGSTVYVVGHPLGLGWSVSSGVLSGYRNLSGKPMIQTDAAISPGNSGGPMFDNNGHLIGIVTAKIQGLAAENIAFARPYDVLRDFMVRAGVMRAEQ